MVRKASELDITEAQLARLLSLFKLARQHNTLAGDVQKQMSSILTPAQHKRVMKYINDEGDKSGDASGAYPDTGKKGGPWTA